MRVVKNPDGSMQRAALTQTALAKERREIKRQNERRELEAVPAEMGSGWEDPMAQGTRCGPGRSCICGCALVLCGCLRLHAWWQASALPVPGEFPTEGSSAVCCCLWRSRVGSCRHLADDLRGSMARASTFAQPEWKEKALGKAVMFGYHGRTARSRSSGRAFPSIRSGSRSSRASKRTRSSSSLPKRARARPRR